MRNGISHLLALRRIAAALAACGISFCVLGGSRAQRDAAVAEFRDRVPVLLVASPTLSAGLNLPWVSHVVLFHRMRDREAAAQLVARGQRLGREANLQVVELLYEGELEN